MQYLGWVPTDSEVRECVMLQKAIVSERPSSVAGRALSNIAGKIDDQNLPIRMKGGMQFFFSQLLEVSAHG